MGASQEATVGTKGWADVKQVLVVAPDQTLGAALGHILADLGVADVIKTASAEPALCALHSGVDAAFLFSTLPDHLALRVAQTSTRVYPSPIVVIVSQGPHPDLFALGQAGARANINWPATPDEVSRCLNTQRSAHGLELSVRQLVGRVGIKDAQDWVRKIMLRQALEASEGSRRGAARLLGVTRPAIQRMLREEVGAECSEPPGAPKPLPSSPPPRRSTLRPLGVVGANAAHSNSRSKRPA